MPTMMISLAKVTILGVLLLNAFEKIECSRVPTVYDVLQLVYQICSTDQGDRLENLDCVSYHMGTEVLSVMQRCMSENNNQSSIEEYCNQLTQVEEWTSKHKNPPQHLTRVMGLAALGRMACVLGEIQRPLPMWQAAFTKCFQDYQGQALVKDSSKSRSYNVIGKEIAF